MIIRKIICTYWKSGIRKLSSTTPVTSKFDFKLIDEVKKGVEDGSMKARQHPGKFNTGTTNLPPDLYEAAINVLKEYSKKILLKDGNKLCNYLWSRHAPLEAEEFHHMRNYVESDIIGKEKIDPMSPELPEEYREGLIKSRTDKIQRKMSRLMYNWQPVNYDAYASAVYLFSRLAPDFTVLVRILQNISERDPNFSPLSMLDFGSGVGTGMWAVDEVWKEVCKVAICVDTSADMNEIADLLLRGGNLDNPRRVREAGTGFRQYLPQSDNYKYNLVISSRSLFELPNMESRLKAIDILWKKTSGYLVIIEAGTNAGYKLVQEARDYVLNLGLDGDKNQCHVFSPCPHDKFCPKFLDGTETPCNFSVSYTPFTFNKEKNPSRLKDIFSYVVLKRGRREDGSDEKWPRLIQDPLVRHRHIICRTCTSNGSLQELTATKRRHGNQCYMVCKKSRWGDLLPVVLSKKEDSNSHVEDSEDNNDETIEMKE